MLALPATIRGFSSSVERHLAKVEVASSSLVTRSTKKIPLVMRLEGFFFSAKWRSILCPNTLFSEWLHCTFYHAALPISHKLLFYHCLLCFSRIDIAVVNKYLDIALTDSITEPFQPTAATASHVDQESFAQFMKRYQAGLAVERAAVEHL